VLVKTRARRRACGRQPSFDASARAIALKAGTREPQTAARIAGFGERLLGVGDLLSPRSLSRALWVLAARGEPSTVY